MNKVIISAGILALADAPALCHPPKNMALKLDKASLSVAIEHHVQDPAKHYIDDVVVEVNGRRVVLQNFSVQKDKDSQEAAYMLPGLAKGDKVKVTAACNKGGKMNKEFLVP